MYIPIKSSSKSSGLANSAASAAVQYTPNDKFSAEVSKDGPKVSTN
jgi:hypothetical protein